jgi:hypothetical protein
MKKVRAMRVRPRALPLLMGALALALATGGRASADTCLLSNNWIFDFGRTDKGSVDGAGTVTVSSWGVTQGPIPAQHPVLSGAVQNVDAQLVSLSLVLFDSGGNFVAGAALESPQTDSDSYPGAVEGRTWQPGTPTNFTLDANAMLAQHFPGIDLSTVASVLVNVDVEGGTAQFSNLCLTNVSTQYTVAPLYDPNKAVKSGAVIPLKLQLHDAGGANISSSSLVVSATGLVQKDNQPDGTLTDPGNANDDNNFRYDPTLPGYVFNLKTTGLGSGTWCVTFTVNGQADPSYQLIFNVK